MKLIKTVLFSVGLLFAIPAMAQTFSQSTPGFATFGSTNCPGVVTGCFVPLGANAMASTSQYALTTASTATLTVPAGAQGAFVSVENAGSFTAAVNFTIDGTAPTTSTGHTLPAGSMTYFAKPFLSVLKFHQAAASGAIDVSYVQ